MKKIIVLVLALVLLSSIVFSASKVFRLTDDVDIVKNEECKTIYKTKEVPVYGTCTSSYEEKTCTDPPENLSCTVSTITDEYKCKTGTEILQESTQICEESDIDISIDEGAIIKDYNLDYGKWGKCSESVDGDTAIITCDSKMDGNNDGICQPGESCIQFRITKEGIQKLEKNSNIEFQTSDDTFFLSKPDLKEVAK